ncbi:unnamed protein product, partial [Mesorhabditis belari]|uniref:ShKT domain-containing protein n=1 Tax=Mesorhabditis belari TaxID=2138241 RepID=A0AAF3ETW4_9BILA
MRWWIRLLLFWIFPPLWAQHDMYLLKLVFNYIYDNPAKCGDPFKYEQWLPAYQNCSIACNPESALCLRNTQIDLQMCRELPNICVAGIREFLGWSSTTTISPTQATAWTSTVRPLRETTILNIKSFAIEPAVESNAHKPQNTSTLGQGSIVIRKISAKKNESPSRKLFDPRLYPSTTSSPVNRIFTPLNRIVFEPERSNTVLEPPAASVPNSLITDSTKSHNKVSSTLIQRDVESNFVQSGDPYADILGIKMEAASTLSPYGEGDISFYDELEKAYDLEQAEQNKSFANQSRGGEVIEPSEDHDISIPAEISTNFNNNALPNEETLEPFIETSAIDVPSVDNHVAIPPKDEDLGALFGNPSLATNDIIYSEEANPGDIKHYDESNKLKKILSILKTIPHPTTTTQATTSKAYRKTGRTLIYSIKRRIQSERNPLITLEPSIELLKEMKNDRRYHRLIVEKNLDSKIDKFEHCCEWALAGMCDRHWQKVRKYCPRSCGLLVCEDFEGLQSCTRLLDVNPEECYAGLRQSREQLGTQNSGVWQDVQVDVLFKIPVKVD